MNENCRYRGIRSCKILKELYCKIEPDKPCAFYKPPEKERLEEKENEHNE